MEKDYYHILGVSKNGSPEEIQRAYRKGARRYHPDVNREADAEERFKLLNEAHAVLSNPKKRKLYDRWGDDWQQVEQYEEANGEGSFENRFHHAGDDFSTHHQDSRASRRTSYYREADAGDAGSYEDILREIFGRSSGSQHGFSYDTHAGPRPLSAELSLGLDELIQKTTKTISIVVGPADNAGAAQRHRKKIAVKIPPGVTEGSTIRLKGQGAPGSEKGEAGDLLLTIRIKPDSRFVVTGYDLHAEVAITPWEAALGTAIDIETIEGVVRLKIPAATQSGTQFRLKGKGLPRKQGSGDLLITAMVKIPDSLSDAEKELFEELAEKSSFDPRQSSRSRAFKEAA